MWFSAKIRFPRIFVQITFTQSINCVNCAGEAVKSGNTPTRPTKVAPMHPKKQLIYDSHHSIPQSHFFFYHSHHSAHHSSQTWQPPQRINTLHPVAPHNYTMHHSAPNIHPTSDSHHSAPTTASMQHHTNAVLTLKHRMPLVFQSLKQKRQRPAVTLYNWCKLKKQIPYGCCIHLSMLLGLFSAKQNCLCLAAYDATYKWMTVGQCLDLSMLCWLLPVIFVTGCWLKWLIDWMIEWLNE